jgi:sulfate adenylyltransferase
MARADYLSCLESMRLATGALFPIPFTLPVHEGVNAGARLSLTHPRGDVLATLDVEEVFEIDPALEARALFGSVSEAHPYES